MAPRAIFIGMPGVGKSAVGKRLAKRLEIPFADSDQLVRKRFGRSIPEIIAKYGESEFRKIEAEVIAEALKDFSGILSLGGGAVLHRQTQELLKGHRVVLIEAPDEVLIARLENSPHQRPLIADDIPGGIARLRATRLEIYRSLATDILISDHRPIGFVVDSAYDLLRSAPSIVPVQGDKPYEVTIGSYLYSKLLAQAVQYSGILILHAPPLAAQAQELSVALKVCEKEVSLFELPDGEAAKTAQVLEEIWDFAGQIKLARDGLIITLGGGATTDLGGFAAATWLRGVAVIHIPTTFLAMVDAAIGGKTGINSASGKNMIGAFYPPESVYCDLTLLNSLSSEELLAGMGEAVKCGFIQDRAILELIAEHGKELLHSNHQALREIVERSVKIKAKVVSQDLHENGIREVLNYGHTLAHAIEKHENFQMRHGEAVAIGCVFAAALSEAAGISQPGFADLHRNAFASLGLPISYQGASRKQLLAYMSSDKKVRQHKLRFIVLRAVGDYEVLIDPAKELLDFAFNVVGIFE